MVFECKCCGGSLKIEENASIGVCEYCGNTMTIPKVDDEKIMHLFNRANHLRMKSEFDNAMIVYENIVAEDKKNAEAYWGICLCKYGIEYVTDPNTEKMIPTCHRSSFTSILQDEDYASALEYADSVVQGIYKEEASQIALIQKKLLEVSANEDPYDIFISYKESDNNGTRTKDSVYAQDIYYELTKKDYRVFFSRISLEKVIGKEYEPYIFSALNSAKIMIIVGTSEQNMKAPWVKNEWSRFLSLMQEGAEKTLIPVYRDMDPYDMPEEFLNLQALDMGRLGFMQDLLEGVSKLLSSTKNVKETKTVIIDESSMEARKSVTPLIQRAFIFLEDDNWDKVDEYVERILDIDPYCGQAYLIKLLRTLQLSKVEELANLKERFDVADEYKKIMKYGDSELVELVKGYNQAIINEIDRNMQIAKLISILSKRLQEEKCKEREKQKKEEFIDNVYNTGYFFLKDTSKNIPELTLIYQNSDENEKVMIAEKMKDCINNYIKDSEEKAKKFTEEFRKQSKVVLELEKTYKTIKFIFSAVPYLLFGSGLGFFLSSIVCLIRFIMTIGKGPVLSDQYIFRFLFFSIATFVIYHIVDLIDLHSKRWSNVEKGRLIERQKMNELITSITLEHTKIEIYKPYLSVVNVSIPRNNVVIPENDSDVKSISDIDDKASWCIPIGFVISVIWLICVCVL